MRFPPFLVCILFVAIRTNYGFSFNFYKYRGTVRKIIQQPNKISSIRLRSTDNPKSNWDNIKVESSSTIRKENKTLLIFDKLTNLFPFWVVAFSGLGFFYPKSFKWFEPFIRPALISTMIAMGMTLTIEDFSRVLKNWHYVLVGFIAQYSIMPLSAAFVCKLFHLPPDLASGVILVGCAPGGTASNLVAMIAEADIALSVLMTAASTVAATIMTPLLVTRLAGGYVTIKSSDLVLSALSVVLMPVVLGLGINTKFPKAAGKVSGYTPFLSVLLVSFICGSVSASNSGIRLGALRNSLLAAIVLLHSLGFLVGYVFARVFQATERESRTISIETGMQNSALAVVLAQHMPNPVLSGLPGAISATCHSVLGSLLAAVWRVRNRTNAPQKVQI